MPSNRAALEEIIRNESVMTPYSDIMAFADAIIRAGWRPQDGLEVTDLDELDGLPVGSIVRVGRKVFHKTTNSFFCWTTQDPARAPSEVVIDFGTPVLIHKGETA